MFQTKESGGKILAVIPNFELETNQEFQKIVKSSDFIFDILKFRSLL
jgi:hypothetical protein